MIDPLRSPRRALLPALVAACLLAAPAARAEEPDAETRFHQAYVQEVIQGEVALAAKGYLDLFRAEATPPHLRAEARFRFGVCLVLLGRADEARAQLEALAADEDAPGALRERAKAYLEGIAGLGVGGALEEKLQALVFELARAAPDEEVPVYRDVEVLGRAAIPFLKRLLAHEDQGLRQHAFRLLARMDVEGLGALWSPRIPFAGGGFNLDVRDYLVRRPEEAAPLERTLLALDDAALKRQIERMYKTHLPLSLDFAAALVERVPSYAEWFVPVGDWSAAMWTRVASWLERDDPQLRKDVLRLLLLHARKDRPAPETAAAIFPQLVDAAMAANWWWWRSQPDLDSPVPGFLELAGMRPTEDLLGAVGRVHAMAHDMGAARIGADVNPLWPGDLTGRLQQPLADRELNAEQLAAWEASWRDGFEILLGIYESGPYDIQNHFRPLADLLRKLSPERARALLSWARETADGTTLGTPFHYWLPERIPFETAADVETFVVAMEAANDEGTTAYARELSDRAEEHAELSGDLRAALFRAAPRVVRAAADNGFLRGYRKALPWLAQAVPADEAVSVVAATMRVHLASSAPVVRGGMSQLALPPNEVPKGWYARAYLPALRRVWEDLDPELRDRTYGALTYAIDEWRAHVAEVDEEAISAFLQAHLADLAPRYEKRLAHRTDLFPPEAWIPYASTAGIELLRILPADRRDEIARALAKHEEDVNEGVLLFVRTQASPELARSVFDEFLASGDARLRGLALASVDLAGKPASRKGVEQALAHLLAEEDADLEQLARATHILVNLAPSEALVPAAARLLQGDGRAAVLSGIEIARSLAHPSLLEALRPLLTSLDEKVRTGAQRAIEQIERVQAAAAK